MKLINNTSPQGYISPTQLQMIESNPSMYYRHYIEGYEVPVNKYMILGKRLAKCLEVGYDEHRDLLIESVALYLPGYPKRELKIEQIHSNIPLLGILDGWDVRTKTIGEYKTGKKYTQSMADRSAQLTFYTLLVWLKYNKIPKILLHWAETSEDECGNLSLTGHTKTFETKRTFQDIALFTRRIERAWEDICNLGRIFKVKLNKTKSNGFN